MADSTLAAMTAAMAATGGLFYGTQSGADRKFSLSAAGAALAEAASAAAQRTALGLGTVATQSAAAIAITGGTLAALTGLGIRSTGAAFDLTLASAEVLTAGRTLTFNVGDAARTLALTGNPTLSGITTTGTGTIASTAGKTFTFSNTLTLAGTDNSILNIGTGGTLGTSAFTAATAYATAASITGSGVLATGGFTLTVAATGTAQLTGAALALAGFSSITGTLAASNGGTGVSNAGTFTNASNTTVTGGGTIALAGFTLTVAATGTAALMTVSNTGSFKVTSNVVIGGGSYLAGGGGSGTNISLYGSESDATGSQTVISAHQIKLGSDLAGVTAKSITVGARASSDGTGANLTISPGNGRGAAAGSLILSYFTTAAATTVGVLTTGATLDTTGLFTFAAQLKLSYGNTTGAGIAAFGTNSPASTLTAPYTWITILTSDGSTAYIPAWK